MDYLLNLTDTELTELVKNQKDNEALKILIARHSGIYVDIVNRYSKSVLYPSQVDDLMDEKDYLIYKAALEYDESKSKFGTFVGNKAAYACLTVRHKNKKSPNFYNIEDVGFSISSEDDDPAEMCQDAEILNKLMDFVRSHPDNRVKQIFHFRYQVPDNHKLMTWKAMSKLVGLSSQGCLDLHNKVIKEFRTSLNHETN